MIIKMTSIVDVSIHAVSPALNCDTGSLTITPYATVVSSAKAEPAKTPRVATSNIEIKAFTTVSSSKCTRAGFAGTDTDSITDLIAEYLAISGIAGKGCFLYGIDNFDLPVFR